MSTASRSAKTATLCFGLMALLVLGGLTWASAVSLRLKSTELLAQAKEDHQRRLRLALWRIDPLVMNVLAKEASRPYWEYASYYLAPKALLNTGEDLTGRVIEPSPLLDRRNVENWILLHFHLSPRTGWSSPQIPIDEIQTKLEQQHESNDTVAQQSLLQTLANSYSYADFAESVTRAQTLAQASRLWSIGEGHADVVTDRPSGTRTPQPEQQGKRAEDALADRFAQTLGQHVTSLQQRAGKGRWEPEARAGQNALFVEFNRPPEACDPADVALGNLDNGVLLNDPPGQFAQLGCVTVNVRASGPAPTCTLSPSCTSPARILAERGFST